MNEPTHLDLFSGIGGFSIAAESVGFKTIGFSEIDAYASAVLSKHWPDVQNFGDIRGITKDSVGKIDLITGGFPCQPFSLAGQRRGDSDERHLFPELCRIIGEIRPKWCLLENVPGLMSIDAGRVFGDVLRALAKIGYDVVWNCVPASAVGANHRRDRLWILANTSNSRAKGMRERKDKTVENVQHSNGAHVEKNQRTIGIKSKYANASGSSWWAVEPDVGRVVNGLPNRAHRLKCLGNSIVPQVAQIFLKEIAKSIRDSP